MEKRIKELKKVRYYVGQLMLALLTMSIFMRFVTNMNPNNNISPMHLSNVLFWSSFILFSINLMITICIQDIQLKSKKVRSSIYREGKRKRAA